MNVLTKCGSLDNVITYEHYCDAKADLANIPKNQITLGSTAIVLQDEDGGMGIYIAGSNKEWIAVSISSGGNSGGTTTLDLIHVCSNSEYNSSTGLPTIQEPEENVIYFVPNNGDNNNLFEEWIYVNNEWEKFGSTGNITPSINVNADWFQDDNTAEDYIKNRVGGYYKYNNLTPVYTNNINYTTSDYNNNVVHTFNNILIGDLSIDNMNFIEWLNGNCLIVDINEERHFLNTIALINNDTYTFDEGFPLTDNILKITYFNQDPSYLSLALLAPSDLFTEAPEIKIYRDSNAIVKIPAHFLDLPAIQGKTEGCIILNTEENNVHKNSGGTNYYALAANYRTTASNDYASAFGFNSTATGIASFATGYNTIASGPYSHVEGYYTSTNANGHYAHAEGNHTQAQSPSSHAEGANSIAIGAAAHAEGTSTTNADYAHAEGQTSSATGYAAHAEGSLTVSSGYGSHAEGVYTQSLGEGSHAEGVYTQSLGKCSHAEGIYTIATANAQHVFGTYNISDNNNIEIVGNGEYEELRSNARTLDRNGNEWLAGNLTLNQTTLTENLLSQLLNSLTKEVTIIDTDVIITANSNTRYICGEVSTLNFTPSNEGICNVKFTSGSSKTILTLPNTVKMPDWFEIEANMIYEISIADGIYGVVTSWAI